MCPPIDHIMLIRLIVIGVRTFGDCIIIASDLFSSKTSPLSHSHIFTSRTHSSIRSKARVWWSSRTTSMVMIQQNYIHGDDPEELHPWRWSSRTTYMVMIQHNYIHGDDPAELHTWWWSSRTTPMVMIQQNSIHGDDQAELHPWWWSSRTTSMVMIQHNYIHGDDPA